MAAGVSAITPGLALRGKGLACPELTFAVGAAPTGFAAGAGFAAGTGFATGCGFETGSGFEAGSGASLRVDGFDALRARLLVGGVAVPFDRGAGC